MTRPVSVFWVPSEEVMERPPELGRHRSYMVDGSRVIVLGDVIPSGYMSMLVPVLPAILANMGQTHRIIVLTHHSRWGRGQEDNVMIRFWAFGTDLAGRMRPLSRHPTEAFFAGGQYKYCSAGAPTGETDARVIAGRARGGQ